jgi:hypothetical protein
VRFFTGRLKIKSKLALMVWDVIQSIGVYLLAFYQIACGMADWLEDNTGFKTCKIVL